MKKLVKILCITLSFMLCVMQGSIIKASAETSSSAADWPQGPKASSIVAESAILMEASTGLILYEKNMDEKQYPASVTKIMTALVAIENSSLDEVLTYSKEAVYGIEYGSSNIAVEVGEKLTMEQSLYAMMLESANEVCLGVAEHIAGSVSAFVDMMNERAKELGCTNTHFVNPNGLHDDNHYTTAHDMALISQAAIENETFRKITGTKQYTIPETNKKEARTWIKNHNQMLYGYKYPKYEYENCIGGKTGYTSMAKSTLVTFAEKDGMTLIVVVLKTLGPSYEQNEYTDTTKLFDYGYNNFTLTNVEDSSVTTDSSLFTRYSGLLNEDNPLIYVDPKTKIVLPNDVSLKNVTQSITYNSLNTFHEGENIIGTIDYTYGQTSLGTGNIIYNIQDITKLTTNTQVDANKETQPLTHKSGAHVNKIAIIIAFVVVGTGCIYYAFIVQKRRRKRAYYRQRRERYYHRDDY